MLMKQLVHFVGINSSPAVNNCTPSNSDRYNPVDVSCCWHCRYRFLVIHYSSTHVKALAQLALFGVFYRLDTMKIIYNEQEEVVVLLGRKFLTGSVYIYGLIN